ncbi:MAG: pyridoxal phosphate-dependent aminotransferase [Candidatus Hydrogenedentes bacterium]|nr:pyridoxal phosphate-dependent aminotransferase [Candidatus Hydrogenedentota bacterium]
MNPSDIVDIARGEPDFHTPEHIKQAAIDAIHGNFTKYTPQPGIQPLREAIATKFARENGVHVSPDDVVVSCGGKHSVEQTIRATVGPGDEVLIITPHWFAYPAQVRMAGATPVFVDADRNDAYIPDPWRIRDAITSRTRLLILNSPSNPTGAVYPEETLEAIAMLALEHHLYVLSDEVYERLVYDEARHISIASLNEDIALRTITVNSVSKTHAMTGWRIGYAALPDGLAGKVVDIQKNSTSAPCAISQRAALAALTADQSHVDVMLSAYRRRRSWLLKNLEDAPGLAWAAPRGTFYCFVCMEGWKGKRLGSVEVVDGATFADALLRGAGVRVLAATDFGAPDHIRISFAVGDDVLDEGLARMKALLS